MRFKSIFVGLVLASSFGVSAPMAFAQQQSAPASGGAQQPTAPIGSGTQSGSTSGTSASGAASTDNGSNVFLPETLPDKHPLTSAELYSLGSADRAHNIFDPSLFVIESGTLGYNPASSTLTTSTTQLSTLTTVGGSLSISHLVGRSTTIVSYNGAGNFYRGQNTQTPTTETQSLGISEAMDMGRWTLRLRNDFLYSPTTGFGDQSFGGPGLIGQVGSTGVLGGLNPTFGTGQTIQTGLADRISDTALGEIDYSLSRRTQLTFTGSYDLLRFIQPGFLNSQDGRGQLGYSFILDPRNTLGLTAAYDRTSYQTGEDIEEIDFGGSWGRKVTGRLAFQASAGAGLIRFDNFVPAIAQRWIWNAAASATYSLRRNDYTASYAHTISDGSGVLMGSSTHTATGSAVHHFTRFTNGGINGGYTNSAGLVPAVATVNSFHGFYVGVNLSRQIGRHFNTTFNYGAQRQTAGAGACPVATCSPTTVYQTFGLNVTWHVRQIGIE